MQTPGDVDDDEAARPTAVSRRRGERVRNKSDAFAFTTNNERDSCGSKDTSASDIDGQDDDDAQVREKKGRIIRFTQIQDPLNRKG